MAKKPRRCKGRTKKGKPCKANPLRKGTVVHGVKVSGDYCRYHAVESENLPESSRIGGAQPGAGRPRRKRVTEVMAEKVEAAADEILRPYWRTLGIEFDENGIPYRLEEGGAKVYGTSKDGYVQMSSYDDLEAQMRAAERLQDRVYGKPKQTQEVVGGGPDDPPVQLAVPEDAERQREVAEILNEAGAVVRTLPLADVIEDADVKGNGHKNGKVD